MRVPLVILVAAYAWTACNGGKASTAEQGAAMPSEDGSTTGVITTAYAAEGCPHLVEITTPEGRQWLIPIALDAQYLKDGLKIRFTHRPSRASSGSCGKGQPAILEGIVVQ